MFAEGPLLLNMLLLEEEEALLDEAPELLELVPLFEPESPLLGTELVRCSVTNLFTEFPFISFLRFDEIKTFYLLKEVLTSKIALRFLYQK